MLMMNWIDMKSDYRGYHAFWSSFFGEGSFFASESAFYYQSWIVSLLIFNCGICLPSDRQHQYYGSISGILVLFYYLIVNLNPFFSTHSTNTSLF